MLFNSESYAWFLPGVVALNWILPPGLRPLCLLAASYAFYAYWNAPMLLLVVGLTLANYLLGIAGDRDRDRRRVWMTAGVAVNLLALATFKYVGLLDESADRLAALLGLPARLPAVHALLPLGLSFFAFEFIHYQIEIFRGGRPINSLVRFALFPAFFPTQVAGPIKRYPLFDAQVRARPPWDPVLFVEGLELIARGLVKKVVLADSLLPLVDRGFGAPAGLGSVDAATAMVGFAFQIYLDFSGYTDVGRGSAQLLGYRVPENFSAPYLATSIRDFWRRWHITLSSWLRDYLYIPLGGNRNGRRRTAFNLMVTMALGGLWHGAAWHYVIWGTGHGAALVADRWLGGRPRLPGWALAIGGWAVTQATVLVLWDLFRAPDLHTAGQVLVGLLHPGRHLYRPSEVLLVFGIAGTVMLAQVVAGPRLREIWRSSPAAPLWRPVAIMAGWILASAYAAVALQRAHNFIYFQF